MAFTNGDLTSVVRVANSDAYSPVPGVESNIAAMGMAVPWLISDGSAGRIDFKSRDKVIS
jgi:hypothetical protein